MGSSSPARNIQHDMRGLRKRPASVNYADSPPEKRSRVNKSSTRRPPLRHSPLPELFIVEETLDEGIIDGILSYKLRWHGIDPETNQPWPIEWIPRRNCTQDTIDAWENKKAQKAAESDESATEQRRAESSADASPTNPRKTSSQESKSFSGKQVLASKKARRYVVPDDNDDDEDQPLAESRPYSRPVVTVRNISEAEKNQYKPVSNSQVPFTLPNIDISVSSRQQSPKQQSPKPQDPTPSTRTAASPSFHSVPTDSPAHLAARPESQHYQEGRKFPGTHKASHSQLQTRYLSPQTPTINDEDDTNSELVNSKPIVGAAVHPVVRHEDSQLRPSQILTASADTSIGASRLLILHKQSQVPLPIPNHTESGSLQDRNGPAKLATGALDRIPQTRSDRSTSILSTLGDSPHNISSSLDRAPSRVPSPNIQLSQVPPPRLSTPTPRHGMSSLGSSSARRGTGRVASIWTKRDGDLTQAPSPVPGENEATGPSTSSKLVNEVFASPPAKDVAASPSAREAAAAFTCTTNSSPTDPSIHMDFDASELMKPLPPLDLAIPLFMQDSTKEIYRSILQYKRDERADVEVLQQLYDICTHPELLPNTSPDFDPRTMSADTQIEWTASESSKFAAIRAMLECADKASKHVLFVLKPTVLDLMERYIKALDYTFFRLDQPRSHFSMSGSLIRVTLTTTSYPVTVSIPVDLVIGLDETFDATTIRSLLQPTLHCPFILLFIPNTAEHILRQQGQAPPHDIISVASQSDASIVSISTVSKACAVGVNLGLALLSGSRQEFGQLPAFDIHKAIAGQQGEKRPLELESLENEYNVNNKHSNSKRLKATEEQPGNSTSETSHIDDSQFTKSTFSYPKNSESEYMQQKQLNRELETSLSDLQSRFEIECKAHDALKKRFVELEMNLVASQDRNVKKDAMIETLREERVTLRQELRAAQKVNAESDAPGVKEVEELRNKTKRIEDLEKKLEGKDSHIDYLTTQYRTYQADANSLSKEVQTLRENNEKLEQRRTADVHRLHESYRMTQQQSQSNGLARVEANYKQLQASLTRSAIENRRLTEELEREKDRKGMGASTRSSSLPPNSLPAIKASGLLGMGMGRSTLASALGGQLGRSIGDVSAGSSRAASPAMVVNKTLHLP